MRSRLVGGFTLIEVLVAVFVLAVGVLGAVAAQTVALRTRQESALMSRGVQLATSFADRMRANTAQMRLPDGANPYLQLQLRRGHRRRRPTPASHVPRWRALRQRRDGQLRHLRTQARAARRVSRPGASSSAATR